MEGVNIKNLITPVFDALKNYSDSNPAVFHMPGHKLGKGIPVHFLENPHLLDITEIPGFDNLHDPVGIIKEAQQLAATAYGSDHAFFLVNGSTCGIQAAIMTICKPGDKLIVARDCHKSVIGGMMLAGVRPVYIKPGFDRSFGITTAIDTEDIKKALLDNPEAAGVLITRPNYYGVCSDIKAVSELVHSFNKVLIVDEAHGAHLRFSKKLPCSALEHDADICVQSAHKTLPALTQGAYLHVKGTRVDIGMLKYFLRIIETSSPSYIIMAFLDIARAIMQEMGESLINGLLEKLEAFEEKLCGRTGYRILSHELAENASIDRTRLVINVANTGKTGFEVGKILEKKYNIHVEMSDLYNIVCITTVADTEKEFDRLYSALCGIESSLTKPAESTDIYDREPEIPLQKLELRDVMNAPSVRRKLTEAEGMISKDIITPYPPGIPLICPGEVVSRDVICYIERIIEAGGVVNGVSDNLEIEVL